ncbi:1-phosphatidylinositol 4,5-bisphosphate phosphodiesterase classes I and II-like protein [Anopheles sinensis]|uniref:1-phosphatidylinositol 4,5-bisphosphate phosphodiesterase classes I and II-like protein n=1 Tax=Anopheles sinensis TaxID=74873 RepID=A0A084WFC9_ANOSI|nr:1-phosphatidylinositol 4,5-bisphosphate phosphodiesterase classes I and II-like protein [Anopheles sinensis]
MEINLFWRVSSLSWCGCARVDPAEGAERSRDQQSVRTYTLFPGWKAVRAVEAVGEKDARWNVLRHQCIPRQQQQRACCCRLQPKFNTEFGIIFSNRPSHDQHITIGTLYTVTRRRVYAQEERNLYAFTLRGLSKFSRSWGYTTDKLTDNVD